MRTFITGERPYPCEYCQKRFRVLEKLKVHTRIHTGEKPFPCRFCGRCFTQKNDMVKHERIHSGQNKKNQRPAQAQTTNSPAINPGSITSAGQVQVPTQSNELEFKESVLMQIHQQQPQQ